LNSKRFEKDPDSENSYMQLYRLRK